MKREDIEPKRYTRRPSLRLPAFDYTSNAAYFFTICVKPRRSVLYTPEIRKSLLEIWQSLPNRFATVTLDEFVVMPDHVHGILWLEDGATNTKEQPPTLGKILGIYKSMTTLAWLNYHKTRGITCSRHLWERGYYDHIIRNDDDLANTRQYIRDNPLKLQLRNGTLPDI